MKKRRLIPIFLAFMMMAQGALGATHTVKKGETYWTISQSYGVSLSALLAANNAQTNDYLTIGQTITVPGSTSTTRYTVKAGDTYWKIAQSYGVSLSALLEANNAQTNDYLTVGQTITIPTGSSSGGGSSGGGSSSSTGTRYTVKSGDTYWKIAQNYGVSLSELLAANNAQTNSALTVGQTITIPVSSSGGSSSGGSSASTQPYITYKTYTVKSGDTFWTIANDCGIPMEELLSCNKLTTSSTIYTGMKLTVPVHNVPVTSTPSSKYGEYLDWWTQAQYVLPVGAVFTVQDFATGATFTAKRTTGAGHADCEPLTASDTAKMKAIWGGTFSWTRRPILIYYNGRKLAASASSMLHAGNDNAPGGLWTSWRSDDYGAGYNFDWVKGNNAHGVFDIHFLNSTRHSDGTVDSKHQTNIRTAAGR